MGYQIKLGVAGTGMISGIFARFCLQNPDYRINSILGTSEEKAENFAKGIIDEPNGAVIDGFDPEAFGDLEKFLESDINTVYLGVPNKLHFELAKAAILAKKNVLIEKPAVSSAGDFQTLIDLSHENGVHIIEAIRHIWDPNFKVLQDELAKFDKLTGVSLTFRQYSSRYNALKEGTVANVFNKAMDGGALYDLGIYEVSALIALIGEPQKCQYFSTNIYSDVDENGAAILDYGDFLAILQMSKMQKSEQPCEFYDNSGNILSTDNIATLSWVKLNGELVEQGTETKVDLMDEINAFPKLFDGDESLAWTLEQVQDISLRTHNLIAKLHSSDKP